MEDALGSIGSQSGQTGATRTEEEPNSLGNLVSLNFASWNQLDGWLKRLDALRAAA